MSLSLAIGYFCQVIYSAIMQMRCVRSVEVKLSKTLRWECGQKHAKDEENSSDEEMTQKKEEKTVFQLLCRPLCVARQGSAKSYLARLLRCLFTS